jgi:hypothetical protein
MQMSSRFETPSYSDKTTRKTQTLLTELQRQVELVDADIAEEERRTKVHDVSEPTYSLLARNLRGRSNNLLATIAILKRQLGGAEQRAA